MEDKEARGSDGRMLGRVGEGTSTVKTSAISFILSAVSKSSFHSDGIFSKCPFLIGQRYTHYFKLHLFAVFLVLEKLKLA